MHQVVVIGGAKFNLVESQQRTIDVLYDCVKSHFPFRSMALTSISWSSNLSEDMQGHLHVFLSLSGHILNFNDPSERIIKTLQAYDDGDVSSFIFELALSSCTENVTSTKASHERSLNRR